MKKILNTVLIIILIIALVAVGILSYKFIKVQKLYDDNKPLYCTINDKESSDKYEMSFHFKDGILNNYTKTITKKPYSEESFNSLKKTIDQINANYKITTQKLIQDSEKSILRENYNLEGATNEELKNINFSFGKDEKLMNRKEIIDLFEQIKSGEGKDITFFGENPKGKYDVKCE